MKFNWLGVAFVDEKLGSDVEQMIENKTEELKEKALQEFDIFLDRNNLEQVMGMIVKKVQLNSIEREV